MPRPGALLVRHLLARERRLLRFVLRQPHCVLGLVHRGLRCLLRSLRSLRSPRSLRRAPPLVVESLLRGARLGLGRTIVARRSSTRRSATFPGAFTRRCVWPAALRRRLRSRTAEVAVEGCRSRPGLLASRFVDARSVVRRLYRAMFCAASLATCSLVCSACSFEVLGFGVRGAFAGLFVARAICARPAPCSLCLLPRCPASRFPRRVPGTSARDL